MSPLSVVRYAPAEAAVVRGGFPELLSVLEASGQITLLEPCLSNRAKSIVRSPKLYLTDTGLLCALLNVRSQEELLRSPAAGAVWETFVERSWSPGEGWCAGRRTRFPWRAASGPCPRASSVRGLLEPRRTDMGRWTTKLRGLLGVGVTGGVLGAVFGACWWVAESVLGFDWIPFGSLGWSTGLWAGFGAFATTGAGLLLATLKSPGSLRELSARRMAAFGALMGLAAPPALIVLVGASWSIEVAVVAGISAALGGLVGGGLVVAAKRSEGAEFTAAEDLRAIGPGRDE
ncbi:MAG TPA: DUF4143 domain-containing protein [Longimicrobiales bacterium]